MSWRLSITHHSGYRYGSDVVASYNEARISPVTTTEQLVLESTVGVMPVTRPFRYWDYWGTVVHAFDVHVPHRELLVTGESVVETQPPSPRKAAPSWSYYRDPVVSDGFSELLAPTAQVDLDDELREVAAGLAAAPTPDDAVDRALAWVAGAMAYEPGSTEVHTSAVEAWRGGAGVCQDFAHLTLALLRGAGLPARYASGYLHPDPEGAIGETVRGESHAWVEVWLGEWWAVDPANRCPTAERHVLVARGRDYADVPPLKGVYHGGPSETLGVVVELTRMA